MRFGVFAPQGWRLDLVGIEPADHWSTILDFARTVEAGPWESIWLYDHFHTVPVPTDEACHEAWSLVAALAATTERLRIGQMCTCMSYRNPAYLAKVAATCDVISGGRVEMGIGAGWYEHEWRAYGYGFPDAPTRLRMLREGVEIFRQAWTTGKATLDGEFYQVNGALVRPLPLQDGGIPMWVAGGGEKVTLKIAAQYAAYTNFNGGPEAFAHKSELLRAHCETVGTEFGAITRSSNFTVVVDETEAGAQSRIDRIEARLASVVGDVVAAKNVAQFRRPTGDVLVGTPAQIREVLERRIELGLGYTITNFPESAYDLSGVELFETEVLAKLG